MTVPTGIRVIQAGLPVVSASMIQPVAAIQATLVRLGRVPMVRGEQPPIVPTIFPVPVRRHAVLSARMAQPVVRMARVT